MQSKTGTFLQENFHIFMSNFKNVSAGIEDYIVDMSFVNSLCADATSQFSEVLDAQKSIEGFIQQNTNSCLEEYNRIIGPVADDWLPTSNLNQTVQDTIRADAMANLLNDHLATFAVAESMQQKLAVDCNRHTATLADYALNQLATFGISQSVHEMMAVLDANCADFINRSETMANIVNGQLAIFAVTQSIQENLATGLDAFRDEFNRNSAILADYAQNRLATFGMSQSVYETMTVLEANREDLINRSETMTSIVNGQLATFAVIQSIQENLTTRFDAFLADFHCNTWALDNLARHQEATSDLIQSMQEMLAGAGGYFSIFDHQPEEHLIFPKIQPCQNYLVESEPDTNENGFEITNELMQVLLEINPDLYPMWLGAQLAIRSTNPDKIRHALVSAREFFNHVLHALSPDNDVRAWSKDTKYFDDKGRPTREGRLTYIFSVVDSPAMKDYIRKEIQTCLELVNICHKGTHIISAPFSIDQASIIVRSIGASVCLLIDASRKQLSEAKRN